MKACTMLTINPLNAELNPICHLLALLGGATIVDVSRLRVKPVRNITFSFLNNNYNINVQFMPFFVKWSLSFLLYRSIHLERS
jgi:hypothetical protein